MVPDDRFAWHLREEGNRALERGSLMALALAVVSVVALPAVMVLGVAEDLWGPWVFTMFAVLACSGLHLLARRRLLHGPLAWAAMLGFVSMPTVFFLSTEAFLPAGAATWLHGPLMLLYFVGVAITGCLFEPRLSGAAGVVAAAGYALCVAAAWPELARIEAPDPVMRQDFVEWPIYGFRALMMLGHGAVVAALAVVGRRLALGVLREAEEKQAVHRLLGTYVSEEVAARLVAGRDGGQRVHAVVLFCDLRGFTTYSQTAAPEVIVPRLNRYLEAMVGAIHAEGGVVDKFVGDAVMAVFGGLVPVADPAGSAVRAALAMGERLEALNRAWVAEGLEAFAHGVGIHAGEVVQGAVGSPERRDFTVIGDVVNAASRLEGLTRQEGVPVLISEVVARALPPELAARCRSLGPREVKGRSGVLEVVAVDVGRRSDATA